MTQEHVRRKVAIVGTQGVPNAYGGFETLAEYLVRHLHEKHDITVYCSSKDQKADLKEYLGAKLINVPISSHGAAGMVYDSLTLAHAALTHDSIIFLGFGAGLMAPFIPGLKRKMILNFGGLDWKRDKWTPRAQRIIQLCEKLLVSRSRVVVADNELIAQYIRDRYHITPTLIAYGGDQAQHINISSEHVKTYPFLAEKYALALSRIQADNNIEMILEGYQEYTEIPLVFIGNWEGSAYGQQIRRQYKNVSHIVCLDAIYDRSQLDVIRSNCEFYIHGHSAGGTNPSLCEAMYLGLPIIAFASGYNEITTQGNALFFHTAAELRSILTESRPLKVLSERRIQGQDFARNEYSWAKIAEKYQAALGAE